MTDTQNPCAGQGLFGEADATGTVQLRDADRLELELLAVLSERFGRYVFKHRGGTYGYLDEQGLFVSVG